MKQFFNNLFHTSNKSLLFFILVASVSSLLWLLGDSTTELLKYHRESVSNGQFWRVISGHFVHSNGWHLLLNLASLTMIGLLFCHHLSILLWLLSFICSGLMISATYFWYAPQFDSYVGLSAILYSVIIIGALLDFKDQPMIAVIILVFVTGRIIWQQLFGSVDSLADIIEQRVAIESHLFGIVSGYFLGFLLLWRQRHSSTH